MVIKLRRRRKILIMLIVHDKRLYCGRAVLSVGQSQHFASLASNTRFGEVDLRCESLIWEIKILPNVKNQNREEARRWFICRNWTPIEDFCSWISSQKDNFAVLFKLHQQTQYIYAMMEHISSGCYTSIHSPMKAFSRFLWMYSTSTEDEELGWGGVGVSHKCQPDFIALALLTPDRGPLSLPQPHTSRLFRFLLPSLFLVFICSIVVNGSSLFETFYCSVNILQHLEQDSPSGQSISSKFDQRAIDKTFCGGKSKRRFQIKISAGDFKTLQQKAKSERWCFREEKLLTQLKHTWYCLLGFAWVWLGKHRRCREAIISLHNGPWLLIFIPAAQRMKNPDLCVEEIHIYMYR